MPFLTTALAVGGIAAGVGSSIAASTSQAGAAKSAAQLQAEEAQKSLDFQKQVYEENVAREQPWITAGTGAINELSQLTSTPGQGLLTPWTQKFEAPTNLTEQNDPGFQARLKMGQQALEDSAAARGGLLTGGTAKDLTQYSQDFASNEYGNVYNRAQEQYQEAYNIFRNNQTDTFNRLSGVAGTGQTATSTAANLGQSAANTSANINLTAGQQIGQDIQNAGAATASGYVGASNAITGGINNLSGLALLQQILKNQNAGGGAI